MMFLAFSITSIGLGFVRYIGAGICNIIYGLIAKIFQLFMIVSQLNILSSDEIAPIYQRVTLILTIVMVFYITFEFVKYVVQPDNMTDKEKGVGNIVTRIIIAIILIAFVPRIFTMAYDVQNKLIKNQVFSKVILGEKNIKFDTFGSSFSADVLGVFYSLNSEVCSGSNYDKECREAEQKVTENLRRLREDGEVTLIPGITGTKNVTLDGEKQDVALIRFDGLMAIVIGGFILYLVVLYTIDVGTRYAQLIFLQIMSPVAIIGYISPKKDNVFSKWLKQCITTYLDLFIRLTIIYFVLLIIDVLGDSFNSGSLFAGIQGVDGYKTLAYIALIMGLLVFANKAPKMIGELLPGGGSASIGYGLKGGDRFSPTVSGVKRTWNAGLRTVGGTAGAIYGIKNALTNAPQNMKKRDKAWSAAKAGFQGLKAGASKGGSIRKGQRAAQSSIKTDRDIIDKGGSVLEHDIHGVKYQETKTRIEREISESEATAKAKDSVASAVKDMKVMKTANSYKEDWDQQGFGDASSRNAVVKGIEKASRIYAVSAQDAQAQKTFKDSIKAELSKVYTEAARLDEEAKTRNLTDDELAIVKKRDEALSNIYSNMEIGSTNWDKVKSEIVEARRISEGRNYTTVDKDGKREDKYVTKLAEIEAQVNAMNFASEQDRQTELNRRIQLALEQFAKEIGDVADSAGTQVIETKYSEEYRSAKANANEGKK